MFALCVRKRDFDEILGPQGVLDLGSMGTESANSFKTMISIIFGPGRDTSLQKSFGPGLLQGCYRDI